MESSRREFMKQVGVGAGIAWTAPQVLSVEAAAAASVPAPLFVNWAGAHDVSGDNLTIVVGTGVDELDITSGDFLIAMAANHIDDAHQYGAATPAGWTLVGTVDSIDTGGQNAGVRTRVFTRVAAGEASYSFSLEVTPPVASSAWTLVIAAYSGTTGLDPAAPATATTASGVGSITVGGITPSDAETAAIVLIGSENPVQPWTIDAAYTTQVDYFPNNSVPEILIADSYQHTTSIPSATFTETHLGHPYAAWMIGLGA